MENMIANATPLLTKSFDLFNILMAENASMNHGIGHIFMCQNDTQNIALIDRIIVDLTTILGTIVGFERKFGYLKKDEVKSIDTLVKELQAS